MVWEAPCLLFLKSISNIKRPTKSELVKNIQNLKNPKIDVFE